MLLQWEANGNLSIIDRIKNLVKLRSGEYLALEKLESTYGSCDVIQNTLVFADSDADRPIAVVVPVRHSFFDSSSTVHSSDRLASTARGQLAKPLEGGQHLR